MSFRNFSFLSLWLVGGQGTHWEGVVTLIRRGNTLGRCCVPHQEREHPGCCGTHQEVPCRRGGPHQEREHPGKLLCSPSGEGTPWVGVVALVRRGNTLGRCGGPRQERENPSLGTAFAARVSEQVASLAPNLDWRIFCGFFCVFHRPR